MVAAAVENARPPDMSVVLERISVAVRIITPTSSTSATSSTHASFPILAPDYTCYRDSANTPRCSLYTSYTITRTSYSTSSPTSTSTSPRSTSTSDGNDDDSDPPDLPDSDDNSDSSSNNSTSSSSTPRSTPTGTASGATSGAKDWKASVTFFGLAPLLLLVGVCVL